MLISVTFNVTANILLKRGVTMLGGVSIEKNKIISELLKVSTSPLILIGLALYGFSFFVWLRVLSAYELSRVYPIFASVVFLFTTAGSFLFLKEDITITRIIGIVVILAGIYIVAKS